MMDIAILEGLGLSKGEIKAYLTLLQIGESKVGGIIEKSGMASSAIHNSINTLIEKGLISYIKKGKIKVYRAAPPKQIISFIDEKKKRISEILPDLEARQDKFKEKEEAEIFEGIKGITTMLNLLIEDTKRGDEYRFFAVHLVGKDKEIQDFFEAYDIKRKDRGLIIKGLAKKELKHLFNNRRMLKMKYPRCPIPADTSMCKNKIALISWGEKPVGYLIRSKEIYNQYKEYFDDIWNNYN